MRWSIKVSSGATAAGTQDVCGGVVGRNYGYQNFCSSELSITIHDFVAVKKQWLHLLYDIFFKELVAQVSWLVWSWVVRAWWDDWHIFFVLILDSNDSIHLSIYLKKLSITQKHLPVWPNSETSFTLYFQKGSIVMNPGCRLHVGFQRHVYKVWWCACEVWLLIQPFNAGQHLAGKLQISRSGCL